MAYRFALCSEVFSTPIDETIRAVAGLGFDGIEIAPFNIGPDVDEISSERRAEVRSVAEECGIEIVGLHWLLVSPEGLHMTTADDAVRKRTYAYLESLGQLCADLGGKVMILGSPKARSLEPGTEMGQAVDRTIQGLKGVAKFCGDVGVELLFEPLHEAETNFIQNVEEALTIVDAVDHPALGYMLDCKAMSGMPDGIEGTLRKHGARSGHFHTNQHDGKGPGMGDVDFAPIFAALADSGYDRWVSCEPFDYKPDSITVGRTALETLKAAAGVS